MARKQAKSSVTPTPKKKRKKQSQKEKRFALILVGVLAIVLLFSFVLGVPGIQQALFKGLGIAETMGEQNSVSMGTERPYSDITLSEYEQLLLEQREAQEDAARPEADRTAAVHFISVGQGDATLIESDGEYALIDAGPPDGVDYLLSYLDYVGVTQLKYLVMTHPHADHIGGMKAVVEAYPVERVLLPDLDKAPYPTTSTFEKLLAAMVEKDLPAETMHTGASYTLGKGSLAVLQDGLETEDNENLISPMLLFESGDLRFLCTGDDEKVNEQAALDAGLDLRANLYKAAHHGSSTSNTLEFLEAVQPWLVVIPCGAGNIYGHPHREALENFETVGADLLRTDEDGFIRISPDGNGGLQASITHARSEAA